MELEFSLASFEKSLNIKFHENPSTEGQDVSCGQRHTYICTYTHTHIHSIHPLSVSQRQLDVEQVIKTHTQFLRHKIQ